MPPYPMHGRHSVPALLGTILPCPCEAVKPICPVLPRFRVSHLPS